MDTAPLNAVSTTTFPTHESTTSDSGWSSLPQDRSSTTYESLSWSLSLHAKRLIDLVGAALGLVFLAPVLLTIAVMIRKDSPGPILFLQNRRGRGGQPFRIYKFRTMRPDAETLLTSLEAENEAARGVLFKMRDDPRVTRLGRFLRRTNLDELPQLINVLRGEMSLVGPRPFQERDCERLDALDPAGAARRLEFPPGLTGPWQVGRVSPTDSEHLLELDLGYLDNWSLRLDLQILYRTVFVVLRGFVER